VASALAVRPISQWLATCTELGIPAGQVKDLAEVYADPSIREQGLVWSVQHATLGTVELPGNPLQFSRSAVGPCLPPPVLGQHTEHVRAWVRDSAVGDPQPAAHPIGAHD